MRIQRKLIRILLWTTSVIVALLVIFAVLHPPIVKWAVATYSPEYTGRQITIDHFRLNPFTGNMNVRGLKVLEAAEDTVFLHIDTIDVNTTLFKMLTGTYEIASVRVAHPFVRIIQDGERFNFSDLVDRFTGDTAQAREPVDGTPVHWSLSDIVLASGSFTYSSDLLPFPILAEELAAHSPGLAWDRDTILADAAILMRNRTSIHVDARIVQSDLRYDLRVRLDSASLEFAEPYLAPYLRIGSLLGMLTADVHVHGNGNDPMDLGIGGNMMLTGLRLTDPKAATLAGVERLDLAIDTIDVKNEIYRVHRFAVEKPYVLAELYDDGDNWSRLLVADSTAVDSASVEALGYDPMNPFSMLAYYVRLVAENYDAADYRVDSLAVIDGAVDFNDYTLQNTFRYKLTDLEVTTNGIDSKRDSITLFAHSDLNGPGTFDARVDLDPNSLRNMHFRYAISSLGMPDFGPYTTFFLAHPILSGTTRYACTTSIVDNKLHSENEVFVEDFQFGRNMDVTTAYQLPVRLAVSLLKDKDGNITLDFPVDGDLDDPEYKVMPIVWQVLKNLVIKAVNAPAAMLARTFGASEEELQAVRFLHLQEDLTNKQEKPLATLARIAQAKPELRIELVQAGDRTAEAEAHALLLAKKAFLADSTGTSVDLPKVELEAAVARIDIKSTGFLAWLDRTAGPGDDPVQTRCMRFTGDAALQQEVERLYAARASLVGNWLTTAGALPPGRIIVRDAAPDDELPSSGQPYFHVIYGTTDGDQ